MALQSIINIDVDFYDKKYILINAKQRDKYSRFLSVTCYNHGERYHINAVEHSAYIRYKKPDNYSVFNLCEINHKGEILVELTEQMLYSDGISYADLVIVNKGDAVVDVNTGEIVGVDNASVLSTMTFCIDVSETAVANTDVESSYEYHGLSELLIKAEANYNNVVLTAKSWAVGNTNIRDGENTDNAKYYAQQSSNSANSSATSATNAQTYMNNAKEYSLDALAYKNDAYASMNSASVSETNAATSASNAASSAASASNSEITAKGYATTAQNSMNSASSSAYSANKSATEAKGYLQQAETVVSGLNGAFSPKGTITFAELLELKNNNAIAAGDLYQISDDFTTDENFRISGKTCGAGTSVYYTVNDKFDCFVGATVAGIRCGNETEYKTGMVEITSDNIGAIPSTNIASVDEVKEFLGII